jgi:hypothetical protein
MRRDERGQASIEWITVLGVVGAALLAAGGTALPSADAIPRAVRDGFVRAFCLVSGGDCLSGPPRPCVVGSDERSHERRAAIAVVRLADGRTVLREERSDGTVAVSVEDVARAGAALQGGARLTFGDKGLKAVASLALDGRGGEGRRFLLPDARAADALIARLAKEGPGVQRLLAGGGGPAPDEEWWVAGAGGRVEAEMQGLGFGAAAGARNAGVIGIRRRPRTGERTVVLRTDGDVVATLTAPFGRAGVGSPQRVAVEVAFDAADRPLALTVRGARGIEREARLGPHRAHGADLVEAEARLDLADPVAARQARALVEALRDGSPPRALAAGRALGERLVAQARVDVRMYETERRSHVSGGSAGGLLEFGYEVVEETRSARLVAAWGREPGTGWMRRLDCVGVA